MAKSIKKITRKTTASKKIRRQGPPDEISVPARTAHTKHLGHERHLCELVRQRQMDRVASASKHAEHMCVICGRAAALSRDLCEARKI